MNDISQTSTPEEPNSKSDKRPDALNAKHVEFISSYGKWLIISSNIEYGQKKKDD